MNACYTSEAIRRYRGGEMDSIEEVRHFDAHLRSCAACRAALSAQTAYAARGLAAQLTPAPDESRHLDDTQILAAVHNRMDDADRESIAFHLEHCASCAHEVQEMRAFHIQMNAFDFAGARRTLGHAGLHERAANLFTDISHAISRAAARVFAWWHALPINGRLIVALIAGVLTGLLLRGNAGGLQYVGTVFMRILEVVATLFIFVAILHTLLKTEVTGRTASRLAYLGLTNTLVAVTIGLLVGSAARPGLNAHWPSAAGGATVDALKRVIQQPFASTLQDLLSNPLLLVVLLALAFGIALRGVRQEQIAADKQDYKTVEAFVGTLYRSLTLMLNGIVVLFPLAVFAIVAWQVGRQKWDDFVTLLWFSLIVLVALVLQAGFYLTRLWFRAAIRPGDFLHSGRHALLSAFSTASSIVTLPITYATMRDRKDVSERSASLGVLVGGHFSRDGTALYEAITPVFIAQAIGRPLDIAQLLTVGLMSIVAAVASPGLPNMGLITMVLVFRAVNLPAEYILFLPVVDWFLDRCRTTINVMGTMTITCLLEKRTRPLAHTRNHATHDEQEPLEPELAEPC